MVINQIKLVLSDYGFQFHLFKTVFFLVKKQGSRIKKRRKVSNIQTTHFLLGDRIFNLDDSTFVQVVVCHKAKLSNTNIF